MFPPEGSTTSVLVSTPYPQQASGSASPRPSITKWGREDSNLHSRNNAFTVRRTSPPVPRPLELRPVCFMADTHEAASWDLPRHHSRSQKIERGLRLSPLSKGPRYAPTTYWENELTQTCTPALQIRIRPLIEFAPWIAKVCTGHRTRGPSTPLGGEGNLPRGAVFTPREIRGTPAHHEEERELQ